MKKLENITEIRAKSYEDGILIAQTLEKQGFLTLYDGKHDDGYHYWDIYDWPMKTAFQEVNQMLTQIKSEDLLFSNITDDDRTNTYVQLNDYDWMNYIIDTRFRTEDLGTLNIKFEYFGAADSFMKVKQKLDDEIREYEYSYSSSIFVKYIKRFLQKHIESWDSKYAFCGEDIVLDFYNEVISVGKLKENE